MACPPRARLPPQVTVGRSLPTSAATKIDLAPGPHLRLRLQPSFHLHPSHLHPSLHLHPFFTLALALALVLRLPRVSYLHQLPNVPRLLSLRLRRTGPYRLLSASATYRLRYTYLPLHSILVPAAYRPTPQKVTLPLQSAFHYTVGPPPAGNPNLPLPVFAPSQRKRRRFSFLLGPRPLDASSPRLPSRHDGKAACLRRALTPPHAARTTAG